MVIGCLISIGGETEFYFKRGKYCVNYRDKEKGIQLRIYAFSKSEGKEVITKTLSIINQSPDWEHLTVTENDSPSSAYPTILPLKMILGESRRMPRKRPVGNVYFTHATCEVYGIPKPIVLYATSYVFRKALINN